MNVEKLSVVTLFAYFGLTGFAVSIAPASPTVPADGLYCSDRYGYRIEDGVEYMPEQDPCKKCQCQDGFPVMCRSVLCSPPTCSMYESLKNECCEFRCIQPSLDLPKNNGNGTSHPYPMLKDANSVNLSIRLVASAVTSLLIFALLIFMIHRLRQRRLLISMRRLNNDRRSMNDDGLAYMTSIDQLDVGFEFPPYEDPPPPYSPPKPMEAPPPYELTSSQIETEPSEIIHTEADALDVRSGVRVATDEILPAISAAAAVMVLGNSGWMNNHRPPRPLSALEPLQSELTELSQLNPDSRSPIALSSPVLTGQRISQKDGRCQSNGCKTGRQGAELFNVAQNSTDCTTPALSQSFVNHSASNHSALMHLAFSQMAFDSSASQVQVKMHSQLAHSSLLKNAVDSSLLKNAVEATGCSSSIRADKKRSEIVSDQHPLLQTTFAQESSPLERSTKILDGFQTMYDHSDPMNLAPVESEVEDDPNETRVKHLSSSKWDCKPAERGYNLMQKSAPTVSLYLKSSQSLCANPSEEKKLINFPKIKTMSKSGPCLCNSSFLKKHKQKCPSRPQSCSVADSEPSSNKFTLDFVHRSLQPPNPTELCSESTIQKKATTEHNSSSLFTSSCTSDSIAAKTQLYISGSAKTVGDGYPKGSHQLFANNNQSDFTVKTRSQGLTAEQPVLEDTLMAVPCQNSPSPVKLPSPAQGSLSPDSPPDRQFLRSESIISQASLNSICSETGEKKHTKSVLPMASKVLTVQGTVSTSSGYLSPEGSSRITDLKKHPVHFEKRDLICTALEKIGTDNCISKHTSTSSAIPTSTGNLPVQNYENYCLSDCKLKHSTRNKYYPSSGKVKNDKRSVSNPDTLQVTIFDALPFSASKYLKELPHQRLLESDQFSDTRLSQAQSYAKNMAEGKEKLSPENNAIHPNGDEADLSYQSCQITVKPAAGNEGHLTFRDQLRKSSKDLLQGNKKHSCNRSKERLNNRKTHKSEYMESLEHLVSRILQQLETSRLDDCGAHHSTVQKVQRPHYFGVKFDRYSTGPGVVCKSVAKQSRPISLPSTTNSSFINGIINPEPADLDVANRNRCMLESVENGNSNDGPCKQLQRGEFEAKNRIDQCPSSGTSVSVAL